MSEIRYRQTIQTFYKDGLNMNEILLTDEEVQFLIMAGIKQLELFFGKNKIDLNHKKVKLIKKLALKIDEKVHYPKFISSSKSN